MPGQALGRRRARRASSHGSPGGDGRTTTPPPSALARPRRRGRTRTTVPGKPASATTTLLPPASTSRRLASGRASRTAAILVRAAGPRPAFTGRVVSTRGWSSVGEGGTLARLLSMVTAVRPRMRGRGLTSDLQRPGRYRERPAIGQMRHSLHATKEFWLDRAAHRRAPPSARSAAEPRSTRPCPRAPAGSSRDLAWHLSLVYGWVRGHRRRAASPTAPSTAAPDHPAARAASTRWSRGPTRSPALLATLDAVDPELPAWNWAPAGQEGRLLAPPDGARDAGPPVGRQMAPAASASRSRRSWPADGVTEVLDSWLPAGRRTGPTDRPAWSQLHATDVDQVWYRPAARRRRRPAGHRHPPRHRRPPRTRDGQRARQRPGARPVRPRRLRHPARQRRHHSPRRPPHRLTAFPARWTALIATP